MMMTMENYFGGGPIYMAADVGQRDVMKFLKAKNTAMLKPHHPFYGQSIMDIAKSKGREDVVDFVRCSMRNGRASSGRGAHCIVQ